jgi:DNA replicative helicase MCM subunit Mcm2 (Cdc46/Mcm family)
MKREAFHVLAVALSLIVVSVPMFAHHGTAAYDLSKTVTVKGKVTKFNFINPHVQVFFDVTGDKGVEQWQAELTSPNHLVRTGWSRDTLKPGDDVTITGYRTKDGSNSIWISKILLRDEELTLATD